MKDKNNNVVVVILSIVILILIGTIIFMFVNGKFATTNNIDDNQNQTDNNQTDEKSENNNNYEENNVEKPNEEVNVIKELDLTKCLNTSDVRYSGETDIEGNYGISMAVNPDKKSITLSIDWSKFGPLSDASMWSSEIKTYQITGFSKNISSVFVGDLGQSAVGITLFYLMQDGTVEYTPMFIKKQDNNNNYYYEINYIYDYTSDGKMSNEHFMTKGAIKGVSNVIKFYTVDATYGITGWRSTIGALRDGSFYDLGENIGRN